MNPQLYNTLTRTEATLRPLAPDQPYRMYCCGPTVYGPAHIGNFRTFLLQDVLRRTLEVSGLSVRHVRNITDVDDKTIRRAQAEGKTLAEFTGYWTRQFHADARDLGMLEPQVEPRATSHIPDQIALIQRLLDRQAAYPGADGSIYFRVEAFADYGKLSHLDRAQLQTQETDSAGEVNDADEYEREHAHDFALWKARKPEDGDNFWPAEFRLADGSALRVEGRPGWHIECSAMSMAYLGETFDLHAGGVDLCFPHHENEIAQSEAATGKPFCGHWFHSAHLQVEGQKMSKSLGNLYTLGDIRNKGHTPMELRYALISGHYRQQLNFTFHTLAAARSALQKLTRVAIGMVGGGPALENLGSQFLPAVPWGVLEPAWHSLLDDLNTPAALGHLFKVLPVLPGDPAAPAALNNFLHALGLRLSLPPEESVVIPEEINQLADARQAAKEARNFAEADRLRAEVESRGYKILDHKTGREIRKL